MSPTPSYPAWKSPEDVDCVLFACARPVPKRVPGTQRALDLLNERFSRPLSKRVAALQRSKSLTISYQPSFIFHFGGLKQ